MGCAEIKAALNNLQGQIQEHLHKWFCESTDKNGCGLVFPFFSSI